jgi:hypothetical protein
MLSFSAQETQKHGCSASQVQENTSQVQVFQRNEPTRRKKRPDAHPNGCESSEKPRTAAKPCVPARNAKTRMLSFSGSIKHFTGSDFPTKRTNETNQRNEPTKRTNEKMLTRTAAKRNANFLKIVLFVIKYPPSKSR